MAALDESLLLQNPASAVDEVVMKLCVASGLNPMPNAGVERGQTSVWVRPELGRQITQLGTDAFVTWSVQTPQLRLSAPDLPRALTLAAIQLVLTGGQILVLDQQGLLQQAVLVEAHRTLPGAVAVGPALSHQLELATRLHPLMHSPASPVPSYSWGGWRARMSPFGDAVEVEIPLGGDDWFTSYLSQDISTGVTYAYAALSDDLVSELAALLPVLERLGSTAGSTLPTLTGLLASGSQDALGLAYLQRHDAADVLVVSWSDFEPASLALDAHARLSVKCLDVVCANIFRELLQLRAAVSGLSRSAAVVAPAQTPVDEVTPVLKWVDENVGYLTRIVSNLSLLSF